MRKIAVFSLIFLMALTTVNAQQEIRSEINKTFTTFSVDNLQEKLFLHTDKDVYVTGETLWFKAYVVDGTFHKPLRLSKVLYIEVIDKDKNSIAQEKIELNEGRGSGSIRIPAVKTGDYTVRAYTRWMRNYEPEFFFHKKILILSPDQPSAIASSPAEDVATIQFFPEGGNMVADLESKVGFRISGPDGKGLDASGVIVNRSADTVVNFQTYRLGIGSFSFIPRAGEAYRAIFNQDRKQYTGTLPAVSADGYVVRVGVDGEFLNVKVSYSGNKPDNQNVFLLAHTRQFPYTVQHTVIRNKSANFQLPRKDLLDGITHLTIFNDEKIPVAERLYFSRPKTKLTLETSLQKSVYTTRDEVALTLTSKVDAMPVSANLSVSVFRVDSLQTSAFASFEYYLLLTSDLKGPIDSPEFYVNASGNEADVMFDNLMLTHGWRRFNWKSALSHTPEPAKFAPESEGMIVSGKIKTTASLQSVEGQQLLLSVYGGATNIFSAETNSSGRFEFYVQNSKGDRNLVVANRNNTFLNYVLDNAFEERPSSAIALSAFTYSHPTPTIRERLTHAQVMDQIVKPETSKEGLTSKRSFYKPTVSYTMANYVTFPTVEDVLREYVPEVIVRANSKRLQMFLLDKDKNIFFTQEPLLLVDGVPMVNSHGVIRASAKNLESIEILPKKFFHGPFEFPGIINFKTTDKNLAGFELDSTSFVFAVNGLEIEREFYSPAYQTVEQKNNRLPDFRDVLYWQPNLTTTAANNILRFYTGDKVGKFKVMIHGITNEGIVGSQSFTFEVVESPRQ